MIPVTLVAADLVATGGMDRANLALAWHLQRKGHPVHLVTHRCDPELAAAAGVVVHSVPRPLKSNALGDPLLAVEGLRVARRVGGRVVANGGNCPVADTNWVHYVHAAFRAPPSGTLRQRGQRTAFAAYFRASERLALRRARLVLADSERTRQDLLTHLGLAPERCEVVYYGVDPRRFSPPSAAERAGVRAELQTPPERVVFVFVGGLGDRRKGFDTLFEAFGRLLARRALDAELWVVGTGAELPRWRQRAEAEGLSGRIRLLGFRTDVDRLLKGCDALVSPTRYEPYGLAIAEALCTGLPAVFSACAGVSERLTAPLRPLLVEDPEDAAELAERMERCGAQLEAFRAGAGALGARLREESWDTMAERICRLMGLGPG